MMLRTRLFVATLLLLIAPVPARAQRLPTTVIPEHYDLAFAIDLAHERFEGTTGIDVRVKQPTTEIRLNALDLRFRSASVTVAGRTLPAAVTLNAPEETVTLTVPRPIPAGPARIDLAYDAALNANLRGLYLSRTRKRSYAVTQFESTDARRAFPCFDEPAFKATFSVTVVADRGDTAISNGRIVADQPGPSPTRHTMKFSTTARMSSYLLALAVGNFECLDGGADGVPIRICATPDRKDLGHIALDASQRILHYLDTYNAIKYPFEKLDIVAVPDFAAGAMENTAAIFYRESDLLADSRTASLAARKTIFSILAHEMAHQWFGDLVTMAWWDDVWLNESFATWMAPRAVAALEPSWHMEMDAAEESQIALNLDALNATHPIHVTVSTPAEIESVFDRISYEKGASVLRMLESYVGPDAFRRGVNAYLEKHKYANATSEDFFGAIGAASGKPVDRVMGTFVLQAGVPEVHVTESCAQGHTIVALSQHPFTIEAAPSGEARQEWQIPVCLKKADAASTTCVLFGEREQTIDLGEPCAPWTFVNAGGRGYYRTSYAPETVERLARAAQQSLTAPERLTLVSDEWALMRAGRHSIASYLDVVSAFGRESAASVLDAIDDHLETIDGYLTTSTTRAAFQTFVRTLLDPAYQAVGFSRAASDSEDRRSLRRVILGALGLVANEPEVIERARLAVTKALDGSDSLDPIVAGTLVSIAAAHGDAAMFDAFKTAAEKAANPQDYARYLFALTDFRDPGLIERALDYSLSSDVKSQDASLYLSSLVRNDAARERTWTFVKAHWPQLESKIAISGGDSSLVSSLSAFCSAGARDDVRTFFTMHRLPAADRALSETIERIDNCIAMRERQQSGLTVWLAAR